MTKETEELFAKVERAATEAKETIRSVAYGATSASVSDECGDASRFLNEALAALATVRENIEKNSARNETLRTECLDALQAKSALMNQIRQRDICIATLTQQATDDRLARRTLEDTLVIRDEEIERLRREREANEVVSVAYTESILAPLRELLIWWGFDKHAIEEWKNGAFVAMTIKKHAAILASRDRIVTLEGCIRVLDREMQTDKARVRVLEEALGSVMIGGNHLASALIHWLGAGSDTFPPFETDINVAQGIIKDTLYWDAWVCWRTIMHARAALSAPAEHQYQRESREAPLQEELTRALNEKGRESAGPPKPHQDTFCGQCNTDCNLWDAGAFSWFCWCRSTSVSGISAPPEGNEGREGIPLESQQVRDAMTMMGISQPACTCDDKGFCPLCATTKLATLEFGRPPEGIPQPSSPYAEGRVAYPVKNLIDNPYHMNPGDAWAGDAWAEWDRGWKEAHWQALHAQNTAEALAYAKEWLAARSELNYPIYQTVRALVAEIERLSSPAPLTQGEGDSGDLHFEFLAERHAVKGDWFAGAMGGLFEWTHAKTSERVHKIYRRHAKADGIDAAPASVSAASDGTGLARKATLYDAWQGERATRGELAYCDHSGTCSAPAGTTGTTASCEYCGKELHYRDGKWWTWDAADYPGGGRPQNGPQLSVATPEPEQPRFDTPANCDAGTCKCAVPCPAAMESAQPLTVAPTWPQLNRERGVLIDRKIAGVLTPAERLRLRKLNTFAHAYLDVVVPRDTKALDDLAYLGTVAEPSAEEMGDAVFNNVWALEYRHNTKEWRVVGAVDGFFVAGGTTPDSAIRAAMKLLEAPDAR